MAERYSERYQIVWIHEEQTYGLLTQEGAFVSMIRYTKDGLEYNTYFENDEFTVLDEIGFLHIEEDDLGQD